MNYILAFLNSFSQVFLIENKWSGLLILIAIIALQPRLGIFSAIGVVASIIFNKLIGTDSTLIQTGITGFNSVLIGIVCALFLPKNETALIATAVFCVLFILFQLAVLKYFQLPVFTLPFVLTALIVYFSKDFLNKLF